MINPPKKLINDFLGDKVVLVVEPSTNYRNSIKQFLVNLKVKKLKLVTSVAEARRDMLTLKVGFFIVEWGLDEINGLQFCRALRKEPAYKETPFLLLSTDNLRQDVILASEVHIDGYLLKPFSYEDFAAQMGQIVKARTIRNPLATILDQGDEMLIKGNIDGAEQVYGSVVNAHERSARALCGLAQVKRQRGDHEQAMTLLKRAAATNPEYVEAYRIMLEIAQDLDDRAGIVHAASILNSLSPENPRYTLILARTYLEMQHLEGSETFFKRTLSLSPKLAEAYKGLGNVYLAKDEYEKAMKNFKKALDLDENDIGTLNSLGMTYVRMGQFQEGIAKYMIALKLDPRDFRVLFNIGQAYEKHGDLDKARWYYSQSLVHKTGYERAQRGVERIDRIKKDGSAPKDLIDDDDDKGGGGDREAS